MNPLPSVAVPFLEAEEVRGREVKETGVFWLLTHSGSRGAGGVVQYGLTVNDHTDSVGLDARIFSLQEVGLEE